MGDVVNLRRVRKGKARAEAERRAAENRVAFGRSKDEKRAAAAQAALEAKKLEGHRRDGPADGAE